MPNQDGSDGFLTRMYKNLFVTPSDLDSIENEIRVEKMLDIDDGIYDAAVNKRFNLNVKGNIFSESAEISPVKSNKTSKKTTKRVNSSFENNLFKAEILDKVNLFAGEKQPESGNNLDQLT